MAALIHRFCEAALRPAHGAGTSFPCWGSGTPLREFLHADNFGEACVSALERWNPDAFDALQIKASIRWPS
jgi:GDP-L-fucose synthase